MMVIGLFLWAIAGFLGWFKIVKWDGKITSMDILMLPIFISGGLVMFLLAVAKIYDDKIIYRFKE